MKNKMQKKVLIPIPKNNWFLLNLNPFNLTPIPSPLERGTFCSRRFKVLLKTTFD
jgi:hypothetical protein